MKEILIVGGGPVGVALALALPNARLFAASDIASSGRYYSMGAAAMEFLAQITGETLPASTPVNRFLLCAGGCRQYIDGLSPLCHIMSEDALMTWLRQCALQKNTPTHNVGITQCRQIEGGMQISAPEGLTFSGKLLAVADGSRSSIARLLNVAAATSAYRQQTLTMRVSVSALADDTAAQWFASQDTLALLPLGDHIFSLLWSLPDKQAKTLTTAAAIVAAVQDKIGMEVKIIDESPRRFSLIAMRRATRVISRAAFVGDAAQVIHPLAGQGLNCGLADAALLVQCLRYYDDNIRAGLCAYSAHSSRPTALLHKFTWAFNHLGGGAAPLFKIAALPGIRQWITNAANHRVCGL